MAIGNFDGVHAGHQAVLGVALKAAATKGVPCYALSFEPHPRTLFKPDSPVFRLTPEATKARVLEAYGLDGLLTLPFTRELASTSAEDFVTDFLVNRARARHVISGYNFHFGKNRVGTPEFLQASGEAHGFDVTIVEARLDDLDGAGEPVSSSRIRRLVGEGDLANAAQLLTYRWFLSGTVIKGQQLGRTLGYPTANLELPSHVRLAHGIYAVRLRTADGVLHNGVASYGRRPTFDNGAALLETFIFDYSGDLYGQVIDVSIFDYLRGEEKFDSAEALVVQMKRDEARARKVLGQVKPLSPLDEILSFQGLVSG